MSKRLERVPRLYKVAAKIAEAAQAGLGSVKQLVYDNKRKHPNIKAIYALVTTLFQRKDEVESVLKRSQFLSKEPRSDPWLTKILIIELLWGKKKLPGQSRLENTVRAYEQIFRAHLSDTPLNAEVFASKARTKPRYVRINTLSTSLDDALDGFRDEGWNLAKVLNKTDYKQFLDKIAALAENEFLVDIHVPNLLIFPAGTQFYMHAAYKNGSLILQDKASCLPVHILRPPPDSKVLDMCAAPGMKTTHMAALMNNQGTVYAVERDPRRFETLNRIIETSGAKCVQTVNRDVLTCNARDFPGVQYILVDPSCSGSGMTDRLDKEKEESLSRLEKLAGFQIKILRSALTRYPDAERVVYSTCSIFPEENEDVVRQVLETNTTFKLVPARRFVNDAWQNFGAPDFGDIGQYCLYARPDEDFTNGFFVAVFERLGEGEENQFFNSQLYNELHRNWGKKRNVLENEEGGETLEEKDSRRKKRKREKDVGGETQTEEDASKNGQRSNELSNAKRKKKKKDSRGLEIANEDADNNCDEYDGKKSMVEANQYDTKSSYVKKKLEDNEESQNLVEDTGVVERKKKKKKEKHRLETLSDEPGGSSKKDVENSRAECGLEGCDEPIDENAPKERTKKKKNLEKSERKRETKSFSPDTPVNDLSGATGNLEAVDGEAATQNADKCLERLKSKKKKKRRAGVHDDSYVGEKVSNEPDKDKKKKKNRPKQTFETMETEETTEVILPKKKKKRISNI